MNKWCVDRERFWKALSVRKINLQQLADETGLDVNLVIFIAKGNYISERKFAAICWGLGVDADWLIDETPDRVFAFS